MPTLPPNAALVLPTLKEAIREQERLHAVWLQDEVNDLNTKMVAEIEAIIKAHRDRNRVISPSHKRSLSEVEVRCPTSTTATKTTKSIINFSKHYKTPKQ